MLKFIRLAASRISSPRKVGRYLICDQMASGGMATVHLGRLLGPVGFSKIVAIKRLHAQFAGDPEFLSMFIDEARLASAINHPNVVSSLDVVVEDDELLLVMEYVEGETLAQLLNLGRKRKAPASLGIVQRILCDALDGLHAAHTASLGGQPLNIVHRDVSPQNIMVGVNGVARVLDFGIAKAHSHHQTTRPGHVKGKLSYLSPEQLRGLPVDARTDVFSAGIVLWESLSQCRLFFSDNAQHIAERLLSAPIPAPSRKNSAVSPALDRVVMTALNRDASRRYQSAAEFANALRALPGEATRAEVAAWVFNVAAEGLAQRRASLHDLEALDVASALAPRSSFPKPAPVPNVGDVMISTRAEHPTELVNLAASLTSGGITRSLTPHGDPVKRRRLGLGLGLFVLLGGMLAALAAPFADPARAHAVRFANGGPSTAPKAARAGTAPSSAIVAPSRATSVSVAIPTMELEDLAVAAAPSSAAPPGKRRVPLKTTPAAPVPAPPPAASAAPSPDCNPPYRIDAAGVRRVRFECL